MNAAKGQRHASDDHRKGPIVRPPFIPLKRIKRADPLLTYLIITFTNYDCYGRIDGPKENTG